VLRALAVAAAVAAATLSKFRRELHPRPIQPDALQPHHFATGRNGEVSAAPHPFLECPTGEYQAASRESAMPRSVTTGLANSVWRWHLLAQRAHERAAVAALASSNWRLRNSNRRVAIDAYASSG
jgi:hypothetical protein